MKTILAASVALAGLAGAAQAQSYTPWKPATGQGYVSPGGTAQQAPAQPATGYQGQATPGGYRVEPAPTYPAQPAPEYQAQPATGYQTQPAPGYQTQPGTAAQGGVYLPPTTPYIQQPLPQPFQRQRQPQQQQQPAPYSPSALGWEWQLGALLPDIEACLRRAALKDPVIDGVYSGRRGASRVRIEGRSPTGESAQEECVARDRGVVLREVDADAPPVDGMGVVVYAPVGSRIVISSENVMQPVISGGSRRLIGWILRARDGRQRAMLDPVTINGYPD